MNKYAIYTACIGGYDNIVQPLEVDERFDYILFADEVNDTQIGVWQVRKTPYVTSDKTRMARYIKCHPHELLSQYKATLWMDANIQIITSKVYDRIIELNKGTVEVASIYHPYRDCIYEEAFEVAYSKRFGRLEHDTIAIDWCHYIWEAHYPTHNGLFETGVLYRLNNPLVNKANELWWKCICTFSRRDQLSYNYVLRQLNVKSDYFLPIGEHSASSKDIHYIAHNKVSQRKQLKAGFLEQWRYKTIHLYDWVQNAWKRVWRNAYKSQHPRRLLTIYGIILGVIFSPLLFGRVLKRRFFKIYTNREN